METSGGLSRRVTLRLPHFDYSAPNVFHVTICTHDRRHLFGRVVDGSFVVSAIGEIVEQQWLLTPTLRPDVELDEYQVMPDHLHAILVFVCSDESAGRALRVPTRLLQQPRSLGSLIGGFKSKVTSLVRQALNDPEFMVWQRRYYESVIVSERHLERTRQYIRDNPLRWWLRRS